MNLEKVVFGFFIVLAATLNFGFFVGDLDVAHHHHVGELFAAIVVNLIATILKFGDRTHIGAIHLATSLVADLQLIAAAVMWAVAVHVTGQGMTPEVTASVVSLAGGALLANIISVVILIIETVMLRRQNLTRMSSVFFHALRRMRAPLIAIIVIYAISVLGLTLIPGATAEGQPAPPMSFLHAFYFMSYTATTIGFGEIPAAFSDAQRLWVTVCIYLSVFGWSYLIVGLLALFQDEGILQALAINRFERSVNRIGEPFYVICGYGETGALLARALDWLEMRFSVIDIAEERINELALEDFSAHVPALVADARSPQTLSLAGLHHPKCLGVVSLTNDDGTNLAVAITVRLLNPGIQVLARAQSERTVANLASFGTDHIINPFDEFGEYLALALDEPGCYQLLEWLTGIPGTTLRAETAPPRGHWVVCGYGRFGRAVVRHLGREGLEATVIDPDKTVACELPTVVGEGTDAQSLREAGIERAVGIVAGTDNDVNNLSIAMTAREINPRLFVVIRQNLVAGKVLFSAFNANVTMVSSEIIAHECLAVLTTPLLSRFLEIVKRESDAWADSVVDRLKARVGETVPELWSVRIDSGGAPALVEAGAAGRLELLVRRAPEPEAPLSCLALMLVRNGREQPLPDPEIELALGDELLFAGTHQARVLRALTLKNLNVLSYVKSGRDTPGGWVWQKLSRRLSAGTRAAGAR